MESNNDSSGNISKLTQMISNNIDWKNDSIKLWKEISEEKQKFYCFTVGDRTWEEYKQEEELFLKIKIAFSLFGSPSIQEGEENILNINLEPAQKKTIDRIIEIIKAQSDSLIVYISFIFITALIDGEYGEFPVIRLLKGQNKNGADIVYYIDFLGRIYKNWNDFLRNNVLPKCIYCYPKNGSYNWDREKVLLDYGCYPRRNIMSIMARNMDTLSSVAGIGSGIVGTVALSSAVAPPVVFGATVVGLSAMAWTGIRALKCLIDRLRHGQSVTLSERETRERWLPLVGIFLDIASGGVRRIVTRKDEIGAQIANLTRTLETLMLRDNEDITHIRNKNWTASNYSEFIISILFFYHCIITPETANELHLELKRYVTEGVTESKSGENIVENTTVGLKKNCVKSLRVISKKEDFLEDIFSANGRAYVKNSVTGFDEDRLTKTHEKEYENRICLNLSEWMKKHETIASEKYESKELADELEKMLNNDNIEVPKKTETLCSILNVKNLNEFQIENRQILSSAKPGELFILLKILDVIKSCLNKNETLQEIINKVREKATFFPCRNVLDFCLLLQKATQNHVIISRELQGLYKVITGCFDLIRK